MTVSAEIAAPPTRAKVTAAAESSGIPSRSDAVAEGTASRATPAPASASAVTVNRVFMGNLDALKVARDKTAATFQLPMSVPRPRRRFAHFHLVCGGQHHRPEFDGQFVDLAVERERQLIVRVHSGAGVEPDIESLVGHLQESDRVGLLAGGDDLSVHFQFTAAALGNAGPVISVVERDGVLAGRQRIRSFPAILGEDQHVVVKHRLAPEHIEAPAAPSPAHGGEHAVAAALRYVDLGTDRV